jgi:hypothetical protein
MGGYTSTSTINYTETKRKEKKKNLPAELVEGQSMEG